MKNSIYLASRSPRRAELLQQIGIDFVVVPSDIDESVLPQENVVDYVLRLAKQKAAVCYAQLERSQALLLPVLAADTSVSILSNTDNIANTTNMPTILGKPEDDDDAYRMLSLMSGRWHEVHTAIALAYAGGVAVALSTTRVQMAELSDSVIRGYIASGEPQGKAGAYGIQGLAASFIQRIEGSYSGVMGLPIFETVSLLKQAGIHVIA